MTIRMTATYETVDWVDGEEYPIECGGFTDPHNPWGGSKVELPAHENRSPEWYAENVETVEFYDICEAAAFVLDFPGAVWDLWEGQSEVDYRTGQDMRVTLHVQGDDAPAVLAIARILKDEQDRKLKVRREGLANV